MLKSVRWAFNNVKYHTPWPDCFCEHHFTQRNSASVVQKIKIKIKIRKMLQTCISQLDFTRELNKLLISAKTVGTPNFTLRNSCDFGCQCQIENWNMFGTCFNWEKRHRHGFDIRNTHFCIENEFKRHFFFLNGTVKSKLTAEFFLISKNVTMLHTLRMKWLSLALCNGQEMNLNFMCRCFQSIALDIELTLWEKWKIKLGIDFTGSTILRVTP